MVVGATWRYVLTLRLNGWVNKRVCDGVGGVSSSLRTGQRGLTAGALQADCRQLEEQLETGRVEDSRKGQAPVLQLPAANHQIAFVMAGSIPRPAYGQTSIASFHLSHFSRLGGATWQRGLDSARSSALQPGRFPQASRRRGDGRKPWWFLRGGSFP